MLEIRFKDAKEARQAVINGEIREGDYIIDDNRDIEFYVNEVYTDVKSIYHVALICHEVLYDENRGCSIGLGSATCFITPFTLTFFRVEREEDDESL